MTGTEMYPRTTEAGAKKTERELREMYPNAKRIWTEKGEIPQWGSAIPTSSTFGKTEPGYQVHIEY